MVPCDPELMQANMTLQEEEKGDRVREAEEGHSAETANRNEVGQITVYTDGGCTNPAYRPLRRLPMEYSTLKDTIGTALSLSTGWNKRRGGRNCGLHFAVFEWGREPTEVASDNDGAVNGT